MSVLYVESSALVKLVVEEAESEALLDALADWPLRATSIVTTVEVPRAARRSSGSRRVVQRADELVRALTVIDIDREVAALAATLGPPTLPSLDAIHLATALSLKSDLGGFVTYDDRLAVAAASAGASVLTPR